MMSQPSTADNTMTMTSEEHDQEVEEYIWSLMGRSGLLAEMKSQIAQFVQNNGKTAKENFSVNVSHVQPAILSMIYEYLKWAGMKNTCALLLCESPVQFDTTTNVDTFSGNLGAVPELCTYLSEKLAQAEKSRLSETLGKNELKSLGNPPVSKSLNSSGATSVPPATSTLNETFLVSGSSAAGHGQTGKNVQVSKISPPLVSTPFGDNQSHNLISSQQANKNSSNSSGQPAETRADSKNNHVSHTAPSSNCNSITSELSESESVGKSDGRERNVYTKQYEKNVNDLKKNQSNQKIEKELKPSNSDQSLQQNHSKEHKDYVFMTEKQKMEALNKKFSGSDLFTKKKSTNEEPIRSPTSDIAKQKESEESRFSNPWKKPISVEPNFEDESISDLNDSTAEDVTQDLSMDSDSKIIAANVAECEHLMKLK